MEPVLFFLRSTEQKIATDIFYYAACLDDKKSAPEETGMYHEHIAKREGDIGVYAMVGHEVAGAAWVRLLKATPGTVDGNTPELLVGVKPEFRNRGVGRAMMEQLFQEVAAFYPRVSLCVAQRSPAIAFFERLGFTKVEGSEKTGIIDDTPSFCMIKHVEKKPAPKFVKTYNPSYWMD